MNVLISFFGYLHRKSRWYTFLLFAPLFIIFSAIALYRNLDFYYDQFFPFTTLDNKIAVNGIDIIDYYETNDVDEIYLVDTLTGKVRQLTKDHFMDYQPVVSNADNRVYFISDRFDGTKSIGYYNLKSHEIHPIELKEVNGYPIGEISISESGPLQFVVLKDSLEQTGQISLEDYSVKFPTETIDLGHNRSDFNSTIDFIEPLSDWIKQQYHPHVNNYPRVTSFKVDTNLIADFNNDGYQDTFLYIQEASSGKKGLLFLSENGTHEVIGAGNDFAHLGDDFDWIDEWELVTDTIVYEATFAENGDVLGSREVELTNPALSIRQEEGSGGLVYFNEQEFIWIHQGD